jgi:hypothetical protein
MDSPADGYYFMFEIGWFFDLLIPTLVRVKDGSLYLVGSKPCEIKDLKPCCIPCGGAEECKKLSFDDAALKAFKSIDSLHPVRAADVLSEALGKKLADPEIRSRYFNTRGKQQKEATPERIRSDYLVLSTL